MNPHKKALVVSYYLILNILSVFFTELTHVDSIYGLLFIFLAFGFIVTSFVLCEE